MILDRGYHLNNLDLTIYSEKVRIAPIREKIQSSIASMLGVGIDQVSVKATTWEKMGFIGEGKALACECVCLVED
jgi:2-C-methyl-D-erythritol 2,4-cyclodiphosphate synthase